MLSGGLVLALYSIKINRRSPIVYRLSSPKSKYLLLTDSWPRRQPTASSQLLHPPRPVAPEPRRRKHPTTLQQRYTASPIPTAPLLLSAPLPPTLHQEPQKPARDPHPVVRPPHPRHRLGVHPLAENPLRPPPLQQLGHDLGRELRVALHGERAAGDVHALHGAGNGGAEGFDAGGVVEDDVAVHLEDALGGGVC